MRKKTWQIGRERKKLDKRDREEDREIDKVMKREIIIERTKKRTYHELNPRVWIHRSQADSYSKDSRARLYSSQYTPQYTYSTRSI